MNMAVSRFLQQHTKFISILEGGYPSLHSGSADIETKVIIYMLFTDSQQVIKYSVYTRVQLI